MSTLTAVMSSAVPETLAASAVAAPDPGRDALFGLVNRITFGATEAELALARTMGYQGYLEYQLNHEAIDDSALESLLRASYPALAMQGYELTGLSESEVGAQLIRSTILRAAMSKRQLFERVVEFWTDHFNIWIQDDQQRWYKTIDDREVIRRYALTTFPQLLMASAHSAAMLRYLDNTTNRKAAPNENYARELLELHTMGVDGGYTQRDVQEVARCFTGWQAYGYSLTTASPPALLHGTSTLTFRYNSGDHDDAAKTVLGRTFPAGQGMGDGYLVLEMLSTHPSTARFISRKMLSRFWGENPPQYLADALAQVYLSTGGDIKSMLRYTLNPFLTQARPAKFKRPLHYIISALRALNGRITTPGSLQTPLVGAGHSPYNWSPPDGYPDTAAFWGELLLPRWNLAASLMNGEYSGVTVDTAALFAGLTTAQRIADRLEVLLFGGAGRMLPADKAAVVRYMQPDPPSSTRIREAVGLAISSPSFQWH